MDNNQTNKPEVLKTEPLNRDLNQPEKAEVIKNDEVTKPEANTPKTA